MHSWCHTGRAVLAAIVMLLWSAPLQAAGAVGLLLQVLSLAFSDLALVSTGTGQVPLPARLVHVKMPAAPLTWWLTGTRAGSLRSFLF